MRIQIRRLVSWTTPLVLGTAMLISGCEGPTRAIEDLGTLGGSSVGLGINAAGNVTGSSYLSAGDPHSAKLHAFRYVLGTMLDVGALPPGNVSEGQAINSGGLIVGGSFVEGLTPHAFLATATLNLIDLGTLGGEFSSAWDLNDKGVVTGEASNASNHTRAFVWTSASGMRDLGTLGGDRSVGRAINENGQIAGESRVGSGDKTRAFRFTQSGGMVSLGVLSHGENSSGYGINSTGQVVGESDIGSIITSGGAQPGDPIFGPHAFLWSEGSGMRDLGSLGGGTSRALAISDTGVVVGTSTLPNGTTRAFRWTQAKGMIDLNTLLPADSGWVLVVAWDVNDNGQVTGEGIHNGARRAFRYNPPSVLS